MNFLKKFLKTKNIKKAQKNFDNFSEDVKEKISNVTEKVEDKIGNYLKGKISFNDFLKVEIKIGKIIKAEKIEKSNKLLKLKVDFGKNDIRQIISGIKNFYSTEELLNKKTAFVTNLAPKKIMGLESDGMILGVSEKNTFSILNPEKKDISEGAIAG